MKREERGYFSVCTWQQNHRTYLLPYPTYLHIFHQLLNFVRKGPFTTFVCIVPYAFLGRLYCRTNRRYGGVFAHLKPWKELGFAWDGMGKEERPSAFVSAFSLSFLDVDIPLLSLTISDTWLFQEDAWHRNTKHMSVECFGAQVK